MVPVQELDEQIFRDCFSERAESFALDMWWLDPLRPHKMLDIPFGSVHFRIAAP